MTAPDSAHPSADSTERFSSRVDSYVAARPGYPPEIVATLERAGLPPASTIADVGSGTGLSSIPFLEAGHTVIGVEPNDAMRLRGDTELARYPRFHSVAGRAEATTLPDRSVDAILAGQAFHWFDPPRARAEFTRILRPHGLVLLIWNDRVKAGDPFHVAYEQMLLQHCPEYPRVSASWANEAVITAFFAPATYRTARFENAQQHDLAGLLARLLSSSYVPKDGPAHDAITADATRLFNEHARAGVITMRYETKLFFGRL